MFYQNFLSPQVKQSAIISKKQGIYELPNKLSNDLSLRILINQGISGNFQNLIEWQPSAQSSCSKKDFINTSKKHLKNKN